MAKPNYGAVVNRITVIDNPAIAEVWLDGSAVDATYYPDGVQSITFHSRLNEEELAEFRALMEKVNARISSSLNDDRKIKGWGKEI